LPCADVGKAVERVLWTVHGRKAIYNRRIATMLRSALVFVIAAIIVIFIKQTDSIIRYSLATFIDGANNRI
jgi:uncharacterized membrane protein required for colicin V production